MNKQLQSITPEVRQHIAALAHQADEGLEQRAARYRRRLDVWHGAVVVCLAGLFLFSADRAIAAPKAYSAHATTGGLSSQQACITVTSMLQRL